jgi:hypothetical protein
VITPQLSCTVSTFVSFLSSLRTCVLISVFSPKDMQPIDGACALPSVAVAGLVSRFIDLRTIDGRFFETFHEAASDFGLFDNHNEGFLTLQEAVDSHRTPSQLRFLFAQVLSSKTALGHLSECCLARLYPSRG